MKNIILSILSAVLLLISEHSFGQTVNLPCQTEDEAFIGIDRKDWNNGTFPTHSEGYMHNFEFPESEEDECNKIALVTVEIEVFDIVQNLPADCGTISTYFVNLYLGCTDFGPATCPISNILDEPSFTPISNTTLLYTCPPNVFPFEETLGVDIIPVASTGCTNGQAMVSSGAITIDYEICVTLTLQDLPPPDVSIDADQTTICEGETIELTADTPETDIEWSTGDTDTSIDVGPGSYTVTVTNDQGCTNEATIEILQADPSVTIDASNTIACNGAQVNLTANTSETDIAWSTGDSGASIDVGPGTYMVTVTDINGCTADAEITIAGGNPTVSIDVDPNGLTICQGETVELTANTPESGIEWSTGETSATIEVGPGTYMVTVTDDNNCMSSAEITLTSQPAPIVNVDLGEDEICDDDTTLAEATPGFDDYEWSTGESGDDSILVGPGNYTVTVTDINGCEGIASFTVDGIDPPDPGDNETVDVCNDGTTYDIEGELGPNDNGGTWVDLDGTGIDLNTNDDNVSFAGIDPGVYMFEYTVGSSGPCPSESAVITIIVSNTVNAGNDNSINICSGDSPIDVASLLGTFDAGGLWTDADGSGINLNIDATNVDFSSVSEGTYDFEYQVDADAPCNDAIATITVNIEESVSAGEDNNVSVCQGSLYDLNTALSIDADLGGTWTDNDGTGALTGTIFNTAGLAGQSFSFTYNIGTTGNCGSDSADIVVSVVTAVSAGTDSPDNLICLGETVNLFDLIPDADMGGTFVDNNGTGGLDGNILNTTGLTPGDFSYTYQIGDNIICPADESTIGISIIDNPTFSFNEGTLLCEDDCHIIEFSFSGAPDFILDLQIFNESSVLTSTFNTTGSFNLDSLIVCNSGGNGELSNDTLNVSGSSENWFIVPSNFQDLNCTLNLEPDTIFFQTFDDVSFDINPSLCDDEMVEVNGTIYDINNPSGIETTTAISGCDSIINVNLNFFAPAEFLLNPTLCNGTQIEVNGTIYDQNNPTGVEIFADASVNGCDSTVTIDLMFEDLITEEVMVDLCFGDSIFIDNQWILEDAVIVEDFVTALGCDSMVTTTIDVLDLNITNESAMICSGDSIFLANAWQLEAGVFEDIFQAANGCDSIISTTLTLEVCDLDLMTTVVDNVCAGGSDGSIKLTIGPGDAPYTVSWAGFATLVTGGILNQNADIELCIPDLPSDAYEINITGASGDNLASFSVNVQDENTPIDVTATITDASCGGDDGSIDLEIIGGVPGYSFNWNPDLGIQGDQFNLASGTYDLTVTDVAGCTAEFSYVINTEDKIEFQTNVFDESCSGLNDGALMISDITNAGTNLVVSVNGNPVDAPFVLEDLQPGPYDITLSNDEGCLITETINIVQGLPAQLLDYQMSYQLTAGDSIQIVGTLDPSAASIQWSPSQGLSCDDCPNPIASPISSTAYTLTAIDADGCVDQLMIEFTVVPPVEILIIPNIFSPGSNSNNDIFEINSDLIQSAQFSVYDRWGGLLYNQTTASGEAIVWDGRSNGDFVTNGVYVFLLDYIDLQGDRQLRDGSITIVR